jgi:hypothetical protein
MPKANSINDDPRVPTTIRYKSLRRAQCVKVHMDPVPSDKQFIADAVDERVRRILRRKREIVLPSDCSFPVTKS